MFANVWHCFFAIEKLYNSAINGNCRIRNVQQTLLSNKEKNM